MLVSDSGYVSGTFWASIGLAVIAMLTIVVTVVLWRRGNPRRQILYYPLGFSLLSSRAPAARQIKITIDGTTFADPYLFQFWIESRSRRDIGSDDFDRQKPLVFSLGTPVAVPLGDPANWATIEDIAVDNGVIRIGPCLIRKGTIFATQFLTQGLPDVKCENPLKDVKVRIASGGGTKELRHDIVPRTLFPRPIGAIAWIILAVGVGLYVGAYWLASGK